MLRLRTALHSQTACTDMVELLDEHGKLVAGIYATDKGLKIVSKYIENRPDLVAIDPEYPPAILVRLR